jgi:hypothetical protein
MLGKSSTPWEQVYLTKTERLERAVVPGGWVYRSWMLWGTDATVPQFAMVFVPTGAAPAPVNIDVPYLSGVGTVGETLSVTNGNWSNEPTAYAYQWKSDGDNVGIGVNTYLVVDGDVGKTITCIVMATNAGGSTTAPPSNGVQVSS